MDRRVKERLVGATILVVLVVLIVPELLSGPKRAVTAPPAPAAGAASPVHSVTIDLATNKATAENTEPAAAAAGEVPATAESVVAPAAAGTTDVMPHGSTAPSSAVPGAPRPATPAAQPAAPTPLESGGSSPKSGQALVKPEGARHGWSAQLGSFAARTNAERLERQLRAQGFAPFLSSAGSGRALRYRVRVGPVADRAAAEKVIARLQKAGHPASVIAP